MASVRLLVTSTIVCAALTAGFGAASPAHARDDDPVAAAKAGPLSPGVKQLADDAPDPGSEALTMTRPNGDVVLDVRLRGTGPEQLAGLRAAGARIRFTDEALRTVTITIDPADIDALASAPAVESVQQVLRPLTNAACPSGSFVSEGLRQLRADLARADFSVSGRDVTVGVMSDSFDARGGQAVDVADGELPGTGNPCEHLSPVVNLLEEPYGDDEGRAMAQIIHDLAPDAEIMFASAFISPEAFAQGIRDLAAAGADVIVDDVTWLDEPLYQDGVIAKAVADVTDQGVTYFSSAANSNLTLDGNRVASYEARHFRATDCPTAIDTHYGRTPVTCHDFNPGLAVDPTLGVTHTSGLLYTLGWNEPEYGIETDLDLCLLDETDAVLQCYQQDNLTTEEAFEAAWDFRYGSHAVKLVVVRYAGSQAPRLKLISHRSVLTSVEYPTSRGTDVVGPTILGHNASRPGVTVAAVEYTGDDQLEWYSSFGPATYCWGPVVGTTPAARLPFCETATVDVTATDGVQNSFFGRVDAFDVHRFYGTSAAAPHAAAVAALMLDREPCLAPAEVIGYLKSTGRRVGATPVDGAGGGLVDARAALSAVGAKGCPNPPPGVSVTAPQAWRNTAVTVDVSATDRRTVVSIGCTSAQVRDLVTSGTKATAKAVVSAEGRTTVTCTGTDGEGVSGAAEGSANSTVVQIDKTAPLLTCRPTTVPRGQPAAVTADVSDPLSGPAAPTASAPVDTATAGSFSTILNARDTAGNTGSAVCGYTVVADITGPTVTCRPLSLSNGTSGTLVADVTDAQSGPVAPTVSTEVRGRAAGTFTAALTASDKAGNSTSVQCPYAVTRVAISGPTAVEPGQRRTFRATGLPASSSVTWTLRHKGVVVRTVETATSATGVSNVRLRFSERGRYVVRVSAAGAHARSVVKAAT